ncbi:Zn-ribbon domain-containing OB-fold protein [Roseovarius amoyensis]|uniref:Zn-ribbon domain-containing OB-fold protein n=1 Tax=Roseovarius amoyensis TaxID=2211448 RepID=UPI000DBE4CF1|nr:OB-fold domain-containing protein [Roseovarius amoyensis]
MATEKTQASDVISGEWNVRYNYSVGKVAGTFFDALKERKILATKSSKSGISYLPPRAYCERSFEPCDEWVEAGHEGVIEAATIVSAAFEHLPPPPYAIAYVRLDGIDTAMINFVRNLDMSDVGAAMEKLKPGTRVRVEFIDDPKGEVTDFHYVL